MGWFDNERIRDIEQGVQQGIEAAKRREDNERYLDWYQDIGIVGRFYLFHLKSIVFLSYVAVIFIALQLQSGVAFLIGGAFVYACTQWAWTVLSICLPFSWAYLAFGLVFKADRTYEVSQYVNFGLEVGAVVLIFLAINVAVLWFNRNGALDNRLIGDEVFEEEYGEMQ